MSIYEFDVELHERTLKEESYADGYNKGEKSGFIKGEESGFIKGEESGFIKGEKSGFIKGEESGFIKGEESGFIKGEESGERKGLIKAYYECGRTITDISRNMGCPEDEVINVLKEMRII